MADLYARLLAQFDDRIRDIGQLGEQDDGMVYVVRAVVELHAPDPDGRTAGIDIPKYVACNGCNEGSWAEGPPPWPCSTILLIAEQLGVPVDEQERIEEEKRDA